MDSVRDGDICTGAWHPPTSLGCKPDALGSAYSGGRYSCWTRVESAYFFQAIHIAVVQMFLLAEREFSFTAAADREVGFDTIELL